MSFYRYAYEALGNFSTSNYTRSLVPFRRDDVVSNPYFTYRFYTSEAENVSNQSCYVVSIGYERRPHNEKLQRARSYNRYSIHYFIKGKGRYNGEGLCGGKMLIVPPCENLFFESDPLHPLEFYYISVSGEGSEGLFKSVGVGMTACCLECPFISKIPDLFYSPLFERHQDTDPAFYLMGLLMQLMGYHKKHNIAEPEVVRGTAFYYYRQAICYIDSYLLSDITPDGIARFLNISGSYFRRIFSTYNENSVWEYILKQRFKYAASKLALTQCSVQEAAESIGYNDYVHFSKMFKKIIGVPPSVYREQSV